MPRCMSTILGHAATSTTESPVVVRPLVASNIAWGIVSTPESTSGTENTAIAEIQMITVTPAASARDSVSAAASRAPKK